MGKVAIDGRLLTLLAVIAIMAGAILVCWQVQDVDAASTTNRTLPAATTAPSTYRTTNLTGPNPTSGNITLNSSLLQVPVNQHLLPALSSSTAYLLNKDFDTVSVIDLDKQKVIKNIKVGSYPVDMAWNAAKNRLYVVNGGIPAPSRSSTPRPTRSRERSTCSSPGRRTSRSARTARKSTSPPITITILHRFNRT